MIYTAKEGVDRRGKEKLLIAELLIVPLIMVAVTAYSLMGDGSLSPQMPTREDNGIALGASLEDINPGASNGSATGGNPPDAASTANSSPQSTSSSPSRTTSSGGSGSSRTTANPAPPPIGGRGGDTGGGGGGVSAGPASCTDLLGSPVVCSTCTNATSLQAGGKYILQTSGLCIKADP